MKIKLYRSATVGLDLGDFKILMDPWLTDGEYYGSWSHFPYYNLDKNLNEINSYDCIYISHIHPDHCSEDTLKKISKKIPVYIHSYHSKFLKFKIERLGFNVIELENNKRTKLSKNAHLNIIAADNCNPELCYKFSGCADFTAKEGHSQQIDTISIIDDGKNVLMNVNDCPFELAQSTFNDIKKNYDKINILLTGYGGAGPYPQCFENLNLEEKYKAAKFKEKQFLDQAIKYIDSIQPDYYLPFAGTYTLSGKLSNLQKLRGVSTIESAYDYFQNYYSSKKLSSKIKPLKLSHDTTFDSSINEYDKNYQKIDYYEYENYIDKVLSAKSLSYEKDEFSSFDEIYELSKKAHQRFLDKILINNLKLETDIFIKVNGNSLMLGKDQNLSVVKSDQIDQVSKKYVQYETDVRLLKRLLMGPKFSHWNNAEIGSHLKFFRKPNIFEREVYDSVIYFHS
ncbi:MBL fold metallo-hydrolase [Candidatus Pelagibacter ubique]|nr:MBL fold metallo-hydrolase [Candidatus Pelagibacter ubique]